MVFLFFFFWFSSRQISTFVFLKKIQISLLGSTCSQNYEGSSSFFSFFFGEKLSDFSIGF